MTPTEELAQVLASATAQGVKIVRKDQHWFWKALGWIVMVVTFGQNKTFTSRYITTIGKTIAVPSTWDSYSDLSKLEILTHELVHVGQYRKYTPPVMGLLYLLVFFPIGLAYFRYRFEREAYVVGFKKTLSYDPSQRQRLIDHGVEQMTSGQYGWTWPFKKSVRAWFEANT